MVVALWISIYVYLWMFCNRKGEQINKLTWIFGGENKNVFNFCVTHNDWCNGRVGELESIDESLVILNGSV